jgi:hypothetical protein
MFSGKRFSAIMWIGTIGLLILWWVVATRVPHQEWPMIFPLTACVLLALDLANKGARS